MAIAVLVAVGVTVGTQILTRGSVVTGGPDVAQSGFRFEGDGTIRSAGKCLTAAAPHHAISTPTLTLRDCDRSAYQHWSALGGKILLNESSAMCLNALPRGDDMWAYPCGVARQDPLPARPAAPPTSPAATAGSTSPAATAGSTSPTATATPAAEPTVTPSPGVATPKILHATVKPGKIDASGAAMPQEDLPGWRQVFADDFRRDVPLGGFPGAVSDRWGGYDGLRDTSKNGLYAPGRVVSVANGVMNLNLHSENGTHLVAAPTPKLAGTGRDGGMLYGRYAVRFRSDPTPGYKTAWLLWPDSDNWSDGEIDFPEGSLNEHIMAFTHQVGDPAESTTYSANATYTAWHTAIIEWTPSRLDFIMDGKVIGHVTDKSHIPSVPMHWVLQTETDLGDAPPSDNTQGNVQIDWVAAWARS